MVSVDRFGVTPFGVSEVRVLMQGSYIAAGIPLSESKGSDLVEKVSKLTLSAEIDSFITHARDGSKNAWAFEHNTVGSMAIIPGGHLVVICGSLDPTGGAAHLKHSYCCIYVCMHV